jgi:hypothetical protein
MLLENSDDGETGDANDAGGGGGAGSVGGGGVGAVKILIDDMDDGVFDDGCDGSDSSGSAPPRRRVTRGMARAASASPPPRGGRGDGDGDGDADDYGDGGEGIGGGNGGDEDIGEAGSQPCIILMDSLSSGRGGSRSHVVRNLQAYLADEWMAKHPSQAAALGVDVGVPGLQRGGELSDAEARARVYKGFRGDNVPGYEASVPQQSNHCDCGVYLLEFIERFAQAPWRDVRKGHCDHPKWWTERSLISRKRVAIREKLEETKALYDVHQVQVDAAKKAKATAAAAAREEKADTAAAIAAVAASVAASENDVAPMLPRASILSAGSEPPSPSLA